MLMKSGSQSLTDQLAERFAARIRDRLLHSGARLPSVRQCATQHQVSPSTVVAAYDQLLAQGLVEARKNRGFFVRETAFAPANRSLSATKTGVVDHLKAARAPLSAATLIRGMFHGSSDKPQPGMGVFPPDWLESTFMPAAIRKVTGTRALQEFRSSTASRRATAGCAGRCRKSSPT